MWRTGMGFIRDIKRLVYEILLDSTLALEAPWNDLRLRSGLVSRVESVL